MYLSRLVIDARGRVGAGWLANPYRVHQRLLMALPDGALAAPDGGPRLLFRVDWPRDDGPAVLLVQSPLEADWERCFADLPVLAGAPLQKAIAPVFVEGQCLRFLLRANPTRRLPGGGAVRADGRPKDGLRVDLRRTWEQLQWLDRQAERHGFRLPERGAWRYRRADDQPWEEAELPEVSVADRGAVDGRKGPGQPRLRHRQVEFEGSLEVTDAAAFAAAWASGIGPGKAFGCGLLSVGRG